VGHEHSAADHPALVERVQRIADSLRREGRRRQRHGSTPDHVHQFDHLVAGAENVADEARLGEQRLLEDLDHQRAAVPHQEVGAVVPQHLDGLVLRAALADEVDHHLGAAAGQLLDSPRRR
jgi:hypothetical protein